MEDASTSATLLLPERPERPVDVDVDVLGLGYGDPPTPIEWALPQSYPEHPSDLGFILRAPGLVVLATAFLIEGYSWLGVLHVRSSSSASVVSGSVCLAVLSLLAPLAAVVLTRGRRITGWALEDLIIGVAVAVTVATITALVVGGSPWRAVAGITDLVLAASVLAAVVLGERARIRSTTHRGRTDRSSAAS